ncbi:hypothetical protein AcV7_000435 [Taiwanofungus camphoratus]|nr:hypothetical protein AcV7_000435 [Antrodia cinnamomea]
MEWEVELLVAVEGQQRQSDSGGRGGLGGEEENYMEVAGAAEAAGLMGNLSCESAAGAWARGRTRVCARPVAIAVAASPPSPNPHYLTLLASAQSHPARTPRAPPAITCPRPPRPSVSTLTLPASRPSCDQHTSSTHLGEAT